MILNVRKCCQGHARGRRVSRGATLQYVGLEAIGVAPLPRSLSSRFGFGIYFTLQVAAHFFCYDGAVLGTILRGVIAPPLWLLSRVFDLLFWGFLWYCRALVCGGVWAYCRRLWGRLCSLGGSGSGGVGGGACRRVGWV